MLNLKKKLIHISFVILCALFATKSFAGGDDEIQVYTDQINGKDNFGWELHQNAVPIGNSKPEYKGDSAPQGQIRHTSEFSYGITDKLEIGAYLPLMWKNGTLNLEGGKGRVKYLDHYNDNVFFGINAEYGYVSFRSEDHHWNTEIRPIIGYRDDNYLVAFNPVIEFSTSGSDSWKPAFSPQIKVSRNIGHGILLGLEHYSNLGAISNIDPWQQQGQTTYLTFDTIKFNTNFNFGIGHGWTSSSNDLTIKFIIGLPVSGWTEKLIGL